ncbi:MAG: methyltransferase domain-containing protein [Patescibacteria group bacterium]
MDKEYAQFLLDKGREDYDKIAQYFSETRFHLWSDFKDFGRYFKDGDTVLDAGCGNGRLSEIFEKIKVHYIGIDSSEKLVAAARVKYPERKFAAADILDLPFTENEFDVVFLIAVFQHVPSREFRLKALENLYRVLKPGGYLIMTNWNLWQKAFRRLRFKYNLLKILGQSKMDFNDILKPWKSPRAELITERYLHGFTVPEIQNLLTKANFNIIKNFYSYRGEKVRRSKSYNIVTIAQKSIDIRP